MQDLTAQECQLLLMIVNKVDPAGLIGELVPVREKLVKGVQQAQINGVVEAAELIAGDAS